MRLCSSLESPQQSPTTTTTSSISSTTSSASLRMSRDSGDGGGGGLLHYHPNQRHQPFLTSNTTGGIGGRSRSAVVLARYEPDVDGVNRPKPPPSLFFVPSLTAKTGANDGQSIDKTSPRRSNRRHNGGLLPAIVCPRSPGSKNVNGNAADIKTFAKIGKSAAAAVAAFELGVDGGGHRLPQIRLKNALSASAAVSRTSIALVASSEIRTVRREAGEQQQKQRHGEPGTKDVVVGGKRRREKAEVTVRVRRRIIISDGSEDAVPSSGDHARGTVAAMPTNTVTERRLNGTTVTSRDATKPSKTAKPKAKPELVMKESIGTQTLLDEDEVNTVRDRQNCPTSRTLFSLQFDQKYF
ncbi:hypothetical protein GPALN_011515 [Globodera pallida]|nr:hypothetical protein GPALN_011515 [Globodera pallida]